jgi:hypothetical protein
VRSRKRQQQSSSRAERHQQAFGCFFFPLFCFVLCWFLNDRAGALQFLPYLKKAFFGAAGGLYAALNKFFFFFFFFFLPFLLFFFLRLLALH